MRLNTPSNTCTSYLSIYCRRLINLILPSIRIINVIRSNSPFPSRLTAITLDAEAPCNESLSCVGRARLSDHLINSSARLSTRYVGLSRGLSLNGATCNEVTARLAGLIRIRHCRTNINTRIYQNDYYLTSNIPSASGRCIVVRIRGLYFWSVFCLVFNGDGGFG